MAPAQHDPEHGQKWGVPLRIGHGFDVHRLVAGRPLILGGVRIAADRGLQGHSDADVLLHAVSDAVLGALALGDIGQWFPDSDVNYRGMASTKLLEKILSSQPCVRWHLANLDATILAQRPKLSPYIREMRAVVAELFGAPLSAVSVKATTTERLGFTGREEGIAAHAVVLLRQNRP